ncbi:MAG: UDP-N-acetylglucosamine--N-acetylmuramyl-(pentapeptide) pyrophosphoryl-undecaprenol N-acetylglucosamine transferase [Pirellulales bacterium]
MRASIDHILFTGGGTAGHLFPGLAVAEELKRVAPQLRISFAGSGKAFEAEHVGRAGYPYVAIPCRPLPRKATETLRFLKDNFHGYYAARNLLREQDVSLVVGLGGYASVPASRAAARLGVPYILLEQNAVPGRATRWLAPGAALVCSALEGLHTQLRAGCRVRVTGNPLRRAFIKRHTPANLVPSRMGRTRRLVVLGGSGGSNTLNTQVPFALYKAGPALHDWQIVHQTGERNAAATGLLYRKLGIRATVAPFIGNLPEVLRSSHLAVSRAGGTTLAELAASGLPAVLLPYPQAADDHQRKNADVFAAAGGAELVDQREVDGRLDNHLAGTIVGIATDHLLRARKAEAMQRMARPEATRTVAEAIIALLAAREPAAI